MKSSLDRACLELVAQATFQKTAEIGFQHAQQNLPYMKQTVLDLPRTAPEKGTSAISMAAGPSLHRRGTIQTIKDLDYRGTLVVADGAMGHCLRNGLIPDYVVCVDPHPTWIIRWFGDPDLARRADDDYFRRQDLDPALKEKIRSFFLTYGQGEGVEADRQRQVLSGLEYSRFSAADDGYLNPIREMVADQKLSEARAKGDTAAIATAERELQRLRSLREVQP